MPSVGEWQRDLARRLTTVVISSGSEEDNRSVANEHAVTHVLLQRDGEVADAYEVPATPTAVLVHSDGSIGSPLAVGEDAIHALVATAVGSVPGHGATVAPPQESVISTDEGDENSGEGGHRSADTREPAPWFSLPSLSGQTVRLDDVRGRSTLLLFWNPDCAFCQYMLPELKEWEAQRPEHAPDLLIISSGPADDNSALGVLSPIVLEQDFTAGRAYGAKGKPSAVLVDEEGRLACYIVMGAAAVLALLEAVPEQGQVAAV